MDPDETKAPEEPQPLVLWAEGESEALDSIFVRSDIGPFIQRMRKKGFRTVGLVIDPDNAWNLEVLTVPCPEEE